MVCNMRGAKLFNLRGKPGRAMKASERRAMPALQSCMPVTMIDSPTVRVPSEVAADERLGDGAHHIASRIVQHLCHLLPRVQCPLLRALG